MALLTVRCAFVVFRMCARICLSCHMCVLVCVLSDACPLMCAFFCCSHMCALIRVFLYVCSNMCAFIFVCSHICVLTCVLSNVCSHTCAVNLRAFPFVLSVLCVFMSAFICLLIYGLIFVSSSSSSSSLTSQPLVFDHFAFSRCLVSLAAIML